jgi:hypothetical protein
MRKDANIKSFFYRLFWHYRRASQRENKQSQIHSFAVSFRTTGGHRNEKRCKYKIILLSFVLALLEGIAKGKVKFISLSFVLALPEGIAKGNFNRKGEKMTAVPYAPHYRKHRKGPVRRGKKCNTYCSVSEIPMLTSYRRLVVSSSN